MLVRCLAFVPALASAHEMTYGKSGTELWEGEWIEINHPARLHEKGYYINKTTYKSPLIPLKTGEAHFTLNALTKMPFPKGNHSVIRADFDLVDEDGNEVGLSEVYNHHWLVGTTEGVNPLVACEDNLFFGAGAEMRGMPTINPEGYGNRRINSQGVCGANLHFIRVDGLATKWDGMNDPSQFDDPMGAAVKNCIECGYAPNRAVECTEEGDGSFACCFTLSRCPPEDPSNRTHKKYRLSYEVEFTEDLTAVKAMQGGVLDVGNGAIEWNVAPNLTDPSSNTVCSDTICNSTMSWEVSRLGDFGDSTVCPGTMLWSYVHQHNGGINGTMFINGKPICTSKPRIGTDPDPKTNLGNEKGFVVSFDMCIDKDNLHNEVRLEAGDILTIESLYDVDVTSRRNFPMPGGKHGGIMGLFFYSIDCDEGTYDTSYVCHNDMCVETGSPNSGDWKTREECESSCGPQPLFA